MTDINIKNLRPNSKDLANSRDNKKRGVSPVIATTLLIAMVVVIGLIVFLWFRGFTEEAITKFGGTNIRLVCGEVQFESSYSSGGLFLSNIGNVPIYSIQLKVQKQGSHDASDIRDISAGWPAEGLNQGGVFSGDVSSATAGASEITVIPVLRGTSKGTARTHVCDEQYGKEITL